MRKQQTGLYTRVVAVFCSLLVAVSAHAFVVTADDVYRYLDNDDTPVEPIRVVTRPLIMGLWGMKIPDTACTEYYNFHEDGDLNVESAAEVSVGKFRYTLRPQGDTLLPLLQMKIITENQQADCADHAIDQSGEESQYFIRWLDQRHIQFCSDENGLNCFATLNKVLP